MTFRQELLYCGPCRARHLERSKPDREDLPRCEQENICEVIQGEPYQLDPENWLPIIIYQKARQLSPVGIVEIHGQKHDYAETRRTVTPEALKLVIDLNRKTVERYGLTRLMDSIEIIQQVYDNHFVDLVQRKFSG